jgi:hypothetical protein
MEVSGWLLAPAVLPLGREAVVSVDWGAGGLGGPQGWSGHFV